MKALYSAILLSIAFSSNLAYARRMITPPPRNHDPDEVQAANLMSDAISGLGCDQSAEALRRLSNRLLGSVSFATQHNPFPPAPGDRRGRMREEMRQKWLAHLRSPAFWQKVWDRLAESYRSCEAFCFEDGVAIGQLSGAGYCAASVALGGLDAPGFIPQAPLPLCGSAIFVGCQKGYQEASRAYQGCTAYTTGQFEFAFKEYQSQDCHLEAGS